MSQQQYTALHVASQRGHLQMVKMLIDRGATVNAVTEVDL
jgi:ankyrin repeat protein